MAETGPAEQLYLAVRDDWLALREEDVLDPGLPIVDPHHHIWRRPASVYMIDELLADLATGHNIVATVYVQCRSMYRQHGPTALAPVGETEFARGVGEAGPRGRHGDPVLCAGIVGHADLTLGDEARPVLEAHCQAGGGRFRGIRHITAWDPDPSLLTPGYPVSEGLMADSRFRAGFAHLAPLGLSFDAWIYHSQIPELASLARAFPDTTIVLDHCGSPLGIGPYAGRRDEIFPLWAAAIRALSECPNVVVKTGGLGMGLLGFDFHRGALPPDSDRLAQVWKPYVETCIDAFGTERCMFESNFPVDKGSYGYRTYWNACKKLAAGASEAERAALFSGTAARTYRIEHAT